MKMPLGTEVDLGPSHIVLDGDPAPPPPREKSIAVPLFSVHIYCGHGRPSQLLLSSSASRYCNCGLTVTNKRNMLCYVMISIFDQLGPYFCVFIDFSRTTIILNFRLKLPSDNLHLSCLTTAVEV